MKVQNRIQQFLHEQGISPYRFWQDTGINRTTAYRLVNDPDYIPGQNVWNAIVKAYPELDPGELLIRSAS